MSHFFHTHEEPRAQSIWLPNTKSLSSSSTLRYSTPNPGFTRRLEANKLVQPLSPEFNYEKAAHFIEAAAQRGAHLAVLPEYHLLNWIPDDPQYAAHCADWQIYLDKYRALAKQHKICIVPGTIIERHSGDDVVSRLEAEDAEEQGEIILANVAYFISNDGEILGRYQKKNLWHPERAHLTAIPHEPHVAFDTPLGRVGMLICWDLAFPEAFRELIAAGAKIIIIPTFWTMSDCSEYGFRKNPLAEKVFLESAVIARAFENTCAVVFVNAGAAKGKGVEGNYAGLSRVTVPFVGAMGEETMQSNEEGMSLVDLDMECIEEAEKHYKVRADIESEGWHYTYRHQDSKL